MKNAKKNHLFHACILIKFIGISMNLKGTVNSPCFGRVFIIYSHFLVTVIFVDLKKLTVYFIDF